MMERKSPIRRTPFKRGDSAIGRHSPIRAVSARRKRQNRERAATVEHMRELQQWCSRCGRSGVGLDAHELLSRAQRGSITDAENIRLVCRRCHQWITENPREAAESGWAISRKWGVA